MRTLLITFAIFNLCAMIATPADSQEKNFKYKVVATFRTNDSTTELVVKALSEAGIVYVISGGLGSSVSVSPKDAKAAREALEPLAIEKKLKLYPAK